MHIFFVFQVEARIITVAFAFMYTNSLQSNCREGRRVPSLTSLIQSLTSHSQLTCLVQINHKLFCSIFSMLLLKTKIKNKNENENENEKLLGHLQRTTQLGQYMKPCVDGPNFVPHHTVIQHRV